MKWNLTIFFPSALHYDTNKLGGKYLNGKALPMSVRREILRMYLNGEKPCEISRKIQASRGCVSKLLKKYRETKSIMPAKVGGSKKRVLVDELCQRIWEIHLSDPKKIAKDIQMQLKAENVEKVPLSTSSISRVLKSYKSQSSSPSQSVSSYQFEDQYNSVPPSSYEVPSPQRLDDFASEQSNQSIVTNTCNYCNAEKSLYPCACFPEIAVPRSSCDIDIDIDPLNCDLTQI